MSGYLHPDYAASLSEFGSPLSLPQCGGWVLTRRIPDATDLDAMGCYPVFACRDWSQLNGDLGRVRQDLVSLFLVTDPFGDYDTNYLRECFPDLVKPFKEHFITNLERPLESFVHPHHLRNAKRALEKVAVEKCPRPLAFLDDWVNLYQTLVDRHNITGIATFSRTSFAGQFSVPGVAAFRAIENSNTVGMQLWYEHDNRAYYHLGAYSIRGYEIGASFALFDYAIRYFCSQRFKWLNLGAGAGTGTGNSGLTRFKKGWSTEVRTAYFCGRIFDRQKYRQLLETTNTHSTDYFPAYRLGEFK